MMPPAGSFLRLAAVVLMLLPAAAHAQSLLDSQRKPPAKTAIKSEQKPEKIARPAPAATSCAQFGAGYIRLEGSSTCVKVGGSIDIGAGMNSRR